MNISPPLTLDELNQALSLTNELLQPLSDTHCLALLIEVRTLTRSRASGNEDVKLILNVYRDRLRAFPADIAAAVLQTWPTRSEFWPTWAELQQQLEPLTARRTEMVRILGKGIEKFPTRAV